MAPRVVVNDVLLQHHYIDGDHDYELVLHGHSHGSVSLPRHHDVGVDALAFNGPIAAGILMSRTDEFALRVLLRLMFGERP